MIAAGLVIVLALLAMNLFIGEVRIPASDIATLLSGGEVENRTWSFIVENRLNRSLAAVFCGAALSLSGLILQVYFRNPLAGPGVLGITSGASLGVAFVTLAGGTISGYWLADMGVVVAGVLGAMAVLLLLLFISNYIQSAVTLLVLGMMFSYFVSAIINVLFLWANADDTREFVLWGMGSFDGLGTSEVITLIIAICAFSMMALVLIKPLNGLVLGTDYARSMGVDLQKTKFMVVLITGVLAAVTTVYCGPISFIGVAVPQLVRLFWKSVDHRILIPASCLLGAVLCLLSDIIVRLAENTLPLNTVTALVGAPVIIVVLFKLNKQLA